MLSPRHFLAVAASAAARLCLLAAMAPAAMAADPLVVSGTVTRDGSPVTGAAVTVLVAGSDMVVAATTDDAGAWSATIDAVSGDTLEIGATTSTSTPDGAGCITTEVASGHVTVMVDALPASVEVVLGSARSSTVCAATATPGPAITPPATDSAGSAPAQGSPAGLPLVLVALGAAVLPTPRTLRLARVRRPRR
jgi:hypothetical protein